MRYGNIPSPHALIAFEAAARCGSFTRAAQELGIGQPAVSHQVTLLEDQLNQPLFRRLHRGVALTGAGQELYDSVSAAFGQIDQTVETIRTRRSTRISVGTDFAFASFILMPHLADFTARFPDIEVNVVTNQTGRFGADANIDIELSFGHCGPQGILLLAERVTPVCSPALLARFGRAQTPADLCKMPLLHLDSEIENRWFNWESWLRTAGHNPGGPLSGHRFNTYLLVLSAALSGQGVALGWTALLQQHLQSGQLVQASTITLSSERGYVLTSRAAPRRQSQVTAFANWAREIIADDNVTTFGTSAEAPAADSTGTL
ncbi:LysR substrate-binding domain-containing protein [Thalassospira marina]|uniref:LysR family transcriptional regulator n=1 Tax=Thalassospira marina TaxID=2048283 RepID=A0A2N3KWG1_9PROT|nr:LysR substrate-binding domain-containing protein [Thalassospira marina]PKR54909.1 LysR family transcriptional regulator [Thalassospira marina]